jgi:pyruvate dehydrogenase E2 component (dihydrolipoamide acetyltransferase)
MIEEIRLPEISENVESGEVIDVLVKVGDFVEAEQAVVELETEKAAFEVPSPVSGKVTELNIEQGQEVKVGQVIAKIDTEGKKEEEKEAPAKEKPEEDKGKEAEQAEPAEKEEAKEEPAEKRREQRPAEKKEEPEEQVKEEEEAEEPEEKAEPGVPAAAAPSIRQLARELGIDINKVSGTGEGGRITADDVKEYARGIIKGHAAKPAAAGTAATRALPDFTQWGDIEREKVTTTRKKIAEALSYTWSNVPQVTQYDRADITNLEETRKAYSSKAEKAGSKLTITSIAIKVVALALKGFPKFNSSFDPERKEIIYKKYYHICVAVDTDRGLLVPVLRDVDKKSISELSAELNELAERARQHKVTPEDMVGGNFTISNLGGIGGTNFAPIIYWPQVGILGVARARREPVFINGRFEPRMILPLSISYDHRVIDGVEGLLFLRWIVKYLENPFLLSLDGKL